MPRPGEWADGDAAGGGDAVRISVRFALIKATLPGSLLGMIGEMERKNLAAL